jgi:hypothetical protein
MASKNNNAVDVILFIYDLVDFGYLNLDKDFFCLSIHSPVDALK